MGKRILKKGKNQLWDSRQSQKGQIRKKVKESSPRVGEVEKKGEMLQQMGDT